MEKVSSLPVIGVMGSGSERHEEWSLPLGKASEAGLAVKTGRPVVTLGERREGMAHAETVEAVIDFVARECGSGV